MRGRRIGACLDFHVKLKKEPGVIRAVVLVAHSCCSSPLQNRLKFASVDAAPLDYEWPALHVFIPPTPQNPGVIPLRRDTAQA
jgi:hypothetical protein